MIELLLPSLLAGLCLSCVTGPLGTFVVWRRMSYFGDTLSHAALLGVAFGFLLNINLFYAIIFVTLILALGLMWLESQKQLPIDTLLGILAHSALSLGLVVISLMDSIRIDLMGYLFGDLLAVTMLDVYQILICVLFIGLMLLWRWNHFLYITVSEELAFTQGINIQFTKLLLTLLLALTIGIAMKFVGALIITSLLIIPAATAKYYAKTPEAMALIAIIIGMLSVIGGLVFSLIYDTPTGPSVVLSGTCLFFISLFLAKFLLSEKNQ
ncbi:MULTISPECIES: zinc ABC transporter permease subunit ZnuB [unclassified Gilliamella]|uniref:zinc ABC transporter permease subunit ZnuB n=1 Tax=unclassified Gilliamella TaxID=2685620 RepID=UPI00226AA386|nr:MULTISPECIES: zinc ABC transporter permease subunit ZnuB [unclassified Gilliamella]MCX8602596.1 zinc ABC transporter permease subunit ZnuB [Gilliamella sp. B3722]MCX8607916.1 zinc ABC transporter permease subunit ZnuB [Gilliamella sp. B3771]MCX8611797.1 zinc ABC transporter permease subunit ZnuB [Gilliamella sp. B3891]MCX8614274.1 zinc ABC transporter permease subunit ZnuB [Gilliamella sp. B3773]MCX8616037.1 zinc ABC transporter permease subunit ZnuB [Gilliamella sp. B3770]